MITRIERQHMPAWAKCARHGCGSRGAARAYYGNGWMLFFCLEHLAAALAQE